MSNLERYLGLMAGKQEQMDEAVYKRFGITEPKQTLQRRTLALYVELGECANEARTFKFWSVKPPADHETVLEEYVDCIHFALSIGIIAGHFPEVNKRLFYSPPITNALVDQRATVNNQLEKCFEAIALMARSGFDFYTYTVMLQKLLNLGSYLGITEDELYNGYIAKNLKNLDRQGAGY